MKAAATKPSKGYTRKNFTLEQRAVDVLERIPKGLQSRFVSEASCAQLGSRTKASLRRAIERGAKRWAEEDLRIAEEWFAVDEEGWRRGARR